MSHRHRPCACARANKPLNCRSCRRKAGVSAAVRHAALPAELRARLEGLSVPSALQPSLTEEGLVNDA